MDSESKPLEVAVGEMWFTWYGERVLITKMWADQKGVNVTVEVGENAFRHTFRINSSFDMDKHGYYPF